MGLRKGATTAKERMFAAKYAATGDRVYAAEKSGYAFPSQAATKLLNNETVIRSIQKIKDHAIEHELGPLSLQVAREILLSSSEKGSVKAAIIKLVWASIDGKNGELSKPLNEMTADELKAASLAAHAALEELRGRAVTIDNGEAVDEAPEPAEPGIFD